MPDRVEDRAYRRPRLGLLLLTAAVIIALVVAAFLGLL